MTCLDDDQGQGLVPPFQIPLAVCSKKRFAELTGEELGVIEAQVERGYLPSVKIGKRRMVNLAKLWIMALSDDGGS